jgi:ATP/maltotriose-dependent transcriptional regulator MalT
LEVLADIERRWKATMPANYHGFATIAGFRSRVALARGDLETAIAESDKAFALVRASPTGARSMPGTLMSRAEIRLRMGRYDDAHRDASQAITLYQEVSGPDAPSARVGKATLVLGEILSAQGKMEEARVAFATAQKHLRPTVGEDHPHTRDATRRLNEPQRAVH